MVFEGNDGIGRKGEVGKKRRGVRRVVRKEITHVVVFFENGVGVSKNRGTPKWMVYNGKPY